jgi:hypothetical protein
MNQRAQELHLGQGRQKPASTKDPRNGDPIGLHEVPIQGVIASATAVARAEAKPEPVRLLGWL